MSRKTLMEYTGAPRTLLCEGNFKLARSVRISNLGISSYSAHDPCLKAHGLAPYLRFSAKQCDSPECHTWSTPPPTHLITESWLLIP